MNKKELRNMKLLEATDELIKLAKEDVPVRDKGYYTEQLIYQRGLYLRAEVENNILKVAFYLAEYLSMDCRKLFICIVYSYHFFISHFTLKIIKSRYPVRISLTQDNGFCSFLLFQ